MRARRGSRFPVASSVGDCRLSDAFSVVALQLAFWQVNIPPFLNFGRLRPLHTNAVIFAFVGNMIFSGIYYSTQRLVKARLPSDLLARVHFWGWQALIVAAPATLPPTLPVRP